MKHVVRHLSAVTLAAILILIILKVQAAYRRPEHQLDSAEAAALAREAPRATVGDFTLVERSGKPLRRADLDGKVWVADFIFTRCQGPCPIMTGQMARLQADLADLPHVRLVSFSMDPRHDTPEVLRAYAERSGASPERWLFATGTPAELEALSTQAFKLAADADGGSVVHSERFVLVDRRGAIRGYYSVPDDAARAELCAAVRRVAAEDAP